MFSFDFSQSIESERVGALLCIILLDSWASRELGQYYHYFLPSPFKPKMDRKKSGELALWKRTRSSLKHRGPHNIFNHPSDLVDTETAPKKISIAFKVLCQLIRSDKKSSIFWLHKGLYIIVQYQSPKSTIELYQTKSEPRVSINTTISLIFKCFLSVCNVIWYVQYKFQAHVFNLTATLLEILYLIQKHDVSYWLLN